MPPPVFVSAPSRRAAAQESVNFARDASTVTA